MQVQNLMTRDVVAAMPDQTIAQVAGVMRTLDVGMLPVIDTPRTRQLVGVITDRDIVVRCLAEGHTGLCNVAEHMTHGPLATVNVDSSLQEAAAIMARYQVRRLPVVHPNGALAGLLTHADIARHLGPSNPELAERVFEHIVTPGALTR